jgi:hypothetical protein
MGIIGRMFPSMSSDKVTVRIPDELPVLMKKVILEVRARECDASPIMVNLNAVLI